MEIILGVLVSIIAQVTKKVRDTKEWANLAIVAGLSLGAAALYTWLGSAGYWDSVLGILTTAGAFYAFIITRFSGAGNSQ